LVLLEFSEYPVYIALNFFSLLNRYPTFVDALRDMDDCLTMVHLFAALPAVDGERVEVKRIHNCRRYVCLRLQHFLSQHAIVCVHLVIML
jgi:pescadillo protein